jgi:DNA-binding transcriptional LysR family regulator
MDRSVNRRTLLKTTTGVAGAAAIGTVASKRSALAAPAFVRQTGSKVQALYWGSFSAELGEAEQEVVRRFNESQQEVELEYQFQGTYEETAQKLTAALAAKQAPDVALLSDVWWFKFYLNRTLAPLNDLIAANEVDTSDYVDSLYNEGVRDEVSYWLPFARSTPLFYYNKEAFAAAGLEPRVAFEVQEAGTIVAMAAEGLGVSVVPALSARAVPHGVALRPLRPRVDRELALAVPSLEQAPPAVHALLEAAGAGPPDRKELDRVGFGMP